MRNLAAVVRRQLPIVIGASALVLGGALASAGSANAKDFVTSGDIRNGTIGEVDVGKGGVSGTRNGQDEIEHGSIGGIDIGKGAVSGSEGKGGPEIEPGSIGVDELSQDAKEALKGEKGEPGEPGKDGKDGEDGTDGVSGYEAVGPEVTWAPGAGTQTAVARCPEGKVLLGGGYTTDNASTQADQTNSSVQLVANGPDPESLVKQDDGTWRVTAYRVTGFNAGDAKFQIQPFALCSSVN